MDDEGLSLRAEAAVHRYRQLGAAAIAAALLWLGWVAWSRQRGLKVVLDAAREW